MKHDTDHDFLPPKNEQDYTSGSQDLDLSSINSSSSPVLTTLLLRSRTLGNDFLPQFD